MGGVSDVDRYVAAALWRIGKASDVDNLVVAVSGGPDSVALLRCLDRLSGPLGLFLHVAHLDHDFRGEEAVEDARFVAALAEELGLPCTVEKHDPDEYQAGRKVSSFEQLAREMRYSFLSATARRVGAKFVALGHTSDDQAETILLHMLRGSGLRGLQGMSEVAPWPWPRGARDVSLFRPLLNLTKADTASYCHELGQAYREDTGNLLRRFTRNRVRRELIPYLEAEYNPKVRRSLLRLSRTASLENDFVETELDRLWPSLTDQGEGMVILDLLGLGSLHPALQSASLRRAYEAIAGDTRRLRESHVASMLDLIAAGATGSVVQLPEGLVLVREYRSLWLGAGEATLCPLPPLSGEHILETPVKAGEEKEYSICGWKVRLKAGESSWAQAGPIGQADRFSMAALGNPLVLRTWQAGDRFQPLGMTGSKKLQDFYTDVKIPRAWRERIPLVIAEQGIAWVVGYRIAEWAKVPTASAPQDKVLWIEMSPSE